MGERDRIGYNGGKRVARTVNPLNPKDDEYAVLTYDKGGEGRVLTKSRLRMSSSTPTFMCGATLPFERAKAFFLSLASDRGRNVVWDKGYGPDMNPADVKPLKVDVTSYRYKPLKDLEALKTVSDHHNPTEIMRAKADEAYARIKEYLEKVGGANG